MQNKNNNNTNFWISYADLMAGLLFVFILLIGAIIVKYTLLQSESNLLEKTLEKEKIALEKNKKELEQKEMKLKNIILELKDTKNSNSDLEKRLKERILENEQLKLTVQEKQKLLEENKDKLELSILSKKEIEEKLNSLDKEKQKLLLKLSDLKQTLVLKDEEFEKLSTKSKEELEEMVSKNLEISKLVELFKKKNQELEDEMKVIQTKLDNTQNEHDILAKELESTKTKIKNLTGIKIKVITLLKEKLGKNINIDPKSGNLSLSSNVLFDEGKSELKPSSQTFLKNAIYDYFQTILENDEINKYIDTIAIEGHTNSVGGFLYNLDLSQKRAFSVMDYLLSLDFKNKEKLRQLVVASGRSYLDLIYDKDGKEDKEASRRIEIKLNIKNEEAIKEIANILK
ncbi:OmpA family protein [Halarcobacter sp.]|uniref:OmpA family protein n=1 Tax=Halarcobacter sp. TaxID=2321133 RepID=UPI002AA7D9AE|nr:OmpA family protein [Halarcobacter sp.]